MYRNAQEAITNAVRHGQATEVSITLDYCTDEIRMTISNNGSEPSEGSIRKGLGMLGMEERLRVIGGQLHIHYDPSFEIHTIIPRRGAAEY